MLGKLEELTLLAVLRVGDHAVPSTVYERFRLAKRKDAFSSVYTTLGRLAAKGLLKEEVVEENGRERRGFSITGTGKAALSDALNASAQIGGYYSGGPYGLA